MRQNQDIALQSATQLEMNPYFFEAFGIGLAWRLALRWSQDKPQLIAGLKALADETYQVAATQNVETAAFYISDQDAGHMMVLGSIVEPVILFMIAIAVLVRRRFFA